MFKGLFRNRMVGNPQYPRYVVRDDRKPGADRFWTGKGWTDKIGEALKYADPEAVFAVLFKLTKRHFARLYHERRYRLTVDVRVYGPGHVTQEQVEEYLHRALIFSMDYEQNGIGPTPDTMVLVSVPNTRLKAVERR